MDIREGDIVQIVPGHKWGGCLAVVREVKSWGGAMVYVEMPMQGPAFIMLKNEDFEKVGRAAFVLPEPEGEE